MDTIADALTYLMQFVKEYRNAIGGAFVSFLVAQDFNLGRFVAGIASGVFCAAYFTEPSILYMPLPSDLPHDQASSIVGALWGVTGYVVISTMMITAQKKAAEYMDRTVDNAFSKGKE